MTDENAVEYDLVMTFGPAVQSGTGPFDDRSFVAGYQVGQIMRSLQVQRAVQGTGMEGTVYTDLLPQLDLVAMTNGFLLEHEPTGVPDWSFVKFVPPGTKRETQ